MKLVFVNQFLSQRKNSTGYLWNELLAALERQSVEVELLESRAGGRERLPKSIEKVLESVRLTALCARRISSGSVVVCGTNPFLLPVLAGFVCRIKGARIFYVVHDLFPENLVAAGILRERSILYRGLRRLFDTVYRRSSGICVIGRDMLSVLSAKTGAEVPLVYIPNWVPSHEDCVVVAVEPRGCCRFQYFGNMGELQGLGPVVEGIVGSTARNATFEFVGVKNSADLCQRFPPLKGDDRIKFRRPVGFDGRSGVISESDVAIVSLKSGMLGLAVPSKAYFSVAHGVPFIFVGEPGSELELSVSENSDIGWFVAAGDAIALAALIDRIAAGERAPRFTAGQRHFLAATAPDAAASRLLKFIDKQIRKP